MNEKVNNRFIRKNPFDNMNIANSEFLNDIIGRSPCLKCFKSRKYFCYTCYIPVSELIGKFPNVKLPIKIDIIKHKQEIDGKSTAAHAALLANDDVSVYTYPNIPNYNEMNDDDGVVLVFPSAKCVTVKSFFTNSKNPVNTIDAANDNDDDGGGGGDDADVLNDNYGLPKGHRMGTLLRIKLKNNQTASVPTENLQQQQQLKSRVFRTIDELPIKRAVFIDSTWNQSRGIYKDNRIKMLKTVVLQNRLSQFWRYQKGSPRWYLATIEAIHQLLLEIHINAWGLNDAYKGLDHLEIDLGNLCTTAKNSDSGDNHNFNCNISEMETDDNSDKAIKTKGKMSSITSPYNGEYDNLLFFFKHMYGLIHTIYDHELLKAYRRPIT